MLQAGSAAPEPGVKMADVGDLGLGVGEADNLRLSCNFFRDSHSLCRSVPKTKQLLSSCLRLHSQVPAKQTNKLVVAGPASLACLGTLLADR